ncbi:MAG: aminopeptidase, partial [Clostridia bacterium]|nr:aminopeptidase [Clostridia bacterium]
MERINAWTTYKKREEKKVMDLGKAYRAFLDKGKTERECVKEAIRRAEQAGYADLEKVEKLQAGDRVYVNTMGKAIQLYIIGTEPLEKGLNIVGAHIDSPRMDLKQNPLYEDTDVAYLDTHYYGGIKKYQWVTLPLALHGVVAKKDGAVADVVIGEDEDDPVVGISDLLIHLSAQQLDKKASVVIEGEALDVIVGGKPLKGAEKEPVKAAILAI